MFICSRHDSGQLQVSMIIGATISILSDDVCSIYDFIFTKTLLAAKLQNFQHLKINGCAVAILWHEG